ncbi:hypothetical protein VNO77_22960 [Canavalia gladiata]|uniref:Uncharacterized protein n=1 Tax=Canavalia gladiata TaxID=3824 RepID=A0AAN9QBF9_CANGL
MRSMEPSRGFRDDVKIVPSLTTLSCSDKKCFGCRSLPRKHLDQLETISEAMGHPLEVVQVGEKLDPDGIESGEHILCMYQSIHVGALVLGILGLLPKRYSPISNISIDHCARVLTRNKEDWGPKPFMFLNYWFDEGSLKQMVEQVWNSVES